MSVSLSGYMVAAPWSGATANYSYPLYVDMGASVQDHLLNWKVRPCHAASSIPYMHQGSRVALLSVEFSVKMPVWKACVCGPQMLAG